MVTIQLLTVGYFVLPHSIRTIMHAFLMQLTNLDKTSTHKSLMPPCTDMSLSLLRHLFSPPSFVACFMSCLPEDWHRGVHGGIHTS